jgi:opacity protein-like surface antigen
MLNAMFDVPIIDDVTLSLGAGAGFDLIDVGSESTAELALQVKAGLAYELTESTDIMLNYRYLSAPGSRVGDFPTGAIGETRVEDVTDSAVTIGVRFGF